MNSMGLPFILMSAVCFCVIIDSFNMIYGKG